MKTQRLTYKNFWGYFWRVTHRHQVPECLQWDQDVADLIERECELSPGAKILDLGCAGGDQAKVFAARGYEITGIDMVPDLIDYAKSIFQKENLNGNFILGDMRSISFKQEFDLCVIFSGTFGLLPEKDNKALLGKIYDSLKPGGFAFIDYLPLELYCRIDHTRTWENIECGYTLAEEWFDAVTSTFRSRNLCIFTEGRIIEAADEKCGANEIIRCYSAREMEEMAVNAGFTVKAHLNRKIMNKPMSDLAADEPRGFILIQKVKI